MAAGTPRFLDISRHFTIHLCSQWIPSLALGGAADPDRDRGPPEGAIDGRLYFWVDVDDSQFFDSSHGSILGFRTGFHLGKDSPESARRSINNRGGLLILFT